MPRKKKQQAAPPEEVSLQEAIGDMLEDAEIEIWAETEKLSARGYKPLLRMALYAYAHRRNQKTLGIASFNFGLSAGNMARAVQRHPEWFDGTIRGTAPQLRMLFVLGQLNAADDRKFYDYWREHQTLQPWEMQRMVTAYKQRNAKPKAKKIRLNGKAIHKGRAGAEGGSIEVLTQDREALNDVVEGASYRVQFAPDKGGRRGRPSVQNSS